MPLPTLRIWAEYTCLWARDVLHHAESWPAALHEPDALFVPYAAPA